MRICLALAKNGDQLVLRSRHVWQGMNGRQGTQGPANEGSRLQLLTCDQLMLDQTAAGFRL